MKKMLLVIMWLLVFIKLASAQSSQQITATFNYSDQTPVNGTFYLSMANQNVIDTCLGGKKVPRSPVQMKVINGVLQSAGLNFTTQDCMKPVVPYYATLYDTSQKLIYEDNWYIPSLATSPVDMSSGSLAYLFGPVLVTIPKAVVQTPATGVNQKILQQAGTVFSVADSLGNNVFAVTPSAGTVGVTGTFSVSGTTALTGQLTAGDIALNKVVTIRTGPNASTPVFPDAVSSVGFPYFVNSIIDGTRSSNSGTQLLFHTAFSNIDFFRINYSAFTSIVGSGTTASITFTWTTSSGTKTFTTPTFSLAATDITGQVNGVLVFRASASSDINYSINSGSWGTSAASTQIVLERF